MTNEERAKQIVDGFFIGGPGNDLQQPNLTKRDLVACIRAGLDEVSERLNLQVRDRTAERDRLKEIATKVITYLSGGYQQGMNGLVLDLAKGKAILTECIAIGTEGVGKQEGECPQCHSKGSHRLDCGEKRTDESPKITK